MGVGIEDSHTSENKCVVWVAEWVLPCGIMGFIYIHVCPQYNDLL